ncbi:hypothetical protein ACPOL_7068 (plasmid) [Acidisarcina polymorpha]|uniref:Uncharacterized protein n=1 Tax=Acidisarcina polymorpha TaxID=2211140 RepID=A0A2Z5GAI6_9BACT|nr:hypothetical protein ACPOL_7068 [Acidisarcina polymorpha]
MVSGYANSTTTICNTIIEAKNTNGYAPDDLASKGVLSR